MVENIYQIIKEDDVSEILEDNTNKLVVFLITNAKDISVNNVLVKKLKLKLFHLAQNNLDSFFGYIDLSNYTIANKLLSIKSLPQFCIYYNMHEINTINGYDFNKMNKLFNQYTLQIGKSKLEWLNSQNNKNSVDEQVDNKQVDNEQVDNEQVDNTYSGTTLEKLQNNTIEMNSDYSSNNESGEKVIDKNDEENNDSEYNLSKDDIKKLLNLKKMFESGKLNNTDDNSNENNVNDKSNENNINDQLNENNEYSRRDQLIQKQNKLKKLQNLQSLKYKMSINKLQAVKQLKELQKLKEKEEEIQEKDSE